MLLSTDPRYKRSYLFDCYLVKCIELEKNDYTFPFQVDMTFGTKDGTMQISLRIFRKRL